MPVPNSFWTMYRLAEEDYVRMEAKFINDLQILLTIEN